MEEIKGQKFLEQTLIEEIGKEFPKGPGTFERVLSIAIAKFFDREVKDRIDRVERRIVELETLVRQLASTRR